MRCIYESVIVPDRQGYKATFPGWEGIEAFGRDFPEVVRNSANVLEAAASELLEKKQKLPEPVISSQPPSGGRVVVHSFNALPTSVSLLLTASDASVVLGVTRSRISNMLRAGILKEGHRDGRSTVITLKSVNARLANPRKPGRPRKNQDNE